ncbi:Probable Bax inhibitor 1 [Geodia barretti]|uniref:Probable Bax inhibitor 1 n=1 Tax=Geodia barretti TaxID=519541 RepID=A0AA35T7J3_GEOBA|nr:Probable Bax inhibitor 1 [Geodia barretti]
MDTLFGNRKISMKALSDFSNLNKGTKQHLKNVYTSLGLTMLSAAAGALGFFLLQLQVSLLAVLGSIGLLFAIMFTPHTPENVTKRLGFLCAFGACTGVSLGPLLGAVADIQPRIHVDETVPYYTYLNIRLQLTLLHLLPQAVVLRSVTLFCGSLLFDTTLLGRDQHNGDDDYVSHSLDPLLNSSTFPSSMFVSWPPREEEEEPLQFILFSG